MGLAGIVARVGQLDVRLAENVADIGRWCERREGLRLAEKIADTLSE